MSAPPTHESLERRDWRGVWQTIPPSNARRSVRWFMAPMRGFKTVEALHKPTPSWRRLVKAPHSSTRGHGRALTSHGHLWVHGSGARKFRAKSAAGFSLIEVVVAILILGIALVGLTEGVTTALSSSKASEVQTTAALLAAGQIETLRAEGDYTDGETDGDFGDDFPLYRWKQTISTTDVDGLHDVDVVVENSQTGQAIYELKTMLFAVPQGTNTVNLAAANFRFSNPRRQP